MTTPILETVSAQTGCFGKKASIFKSLSPQISTMKVTSQ